MTLDSNFIRRLSYIKYLHNQASVQSYHPEPLSSFSLLTFHDAAELFLELACEYKNIPTRDLRFNGYFKKLDEEIKPKKILQKTSMEKLNEARGGLKHKGNLTSKVDIEVFRVNTYNFFKENTKLIFEKDYDSISMVDMVKFNEARNSLKEAEALIVQTKTADAMAKIAIAFFQLVEEYERNITFAGKSPFDFGAIPFDMPLTLTLIGDRHFPGSKLLAQVGMAVSQIQKAMRILSMGLDYKKYSYFARFSPSVTKTDKKYNVTSFIDYNNVSVEFCKPFIDFVIECALRLQES
jgi:hypothetical protein